MESIGERLKRLREAAGITQGELARRVGFKSQGGIGNIESGVRGYGAKIVDIARELGTTPEYLRIEQVEKSARSNTDTAPETRGLVPLISWVQAGQWCEAADPFHPGEAEQWLPCPAPHGPGTFALTVRGDSMTAPHGNTRTYPEGCVIYVNPDRKNPVNGDRVVACLNATHEVTFKVYKNEDGRQWLQPLNPSHEPIREPFHILGTIIGKWESE